MDDMKFRIFNLKDGETQQLESWKNYKNFDGINKYILRDGKISFTDLIDLRLEGGKSKAGRKAIAFFYEDEVVGLALVDIKKNPYDGNVVCYIEEIAVHPECQNIGFGKQMVRFIVRNKDSAISRQKFDVVMAIIRADNAQSLAMFKSLGFAFSQENETVFATLLTNKFYEKHNMEKRTFE